MLIQEEMDDIFGEFEFDDDRNILTKVKSFFLIIQYICIYNISEFGVYIIKSIKILIIKVTTYFDFQFQAGFF